MTKLSSNAETIFKMKYAQKNEGWSDTCLRVAEYVANAENEYNIPEEFILKLTGKYYDLMHEQIFIPGGRVLANAGTGIKNLLNCFVLPIDDSRQSIYETLKNAAEIFAHGGGVGYNFSHIREEGAGIKSTGGTASGPMSFMTLFDQTGEVIQQSSRRGAQIALLNIDHPDIEKFIDFKSKPNSRNLRVLDEYHRNLKRVGGSLRNTKYYEVLEKTLLDDQLTHFNVSVVLSNRFMDAVQQQKNWVLHSVTGEKDSEISASFLMEKIAKHAWESGDPGLLFFDRMNEDNMVHYIGEIEASNPCSEVPLLPYEPCCLGSINLHKMYDEKKNDIDWEFLEYVVRLSVRFLDDVQTISTIPVDKVNYYAKGLRRIGLGVMGFADLIAELGIEYGSESSVKLSRYLSWFISNFAWLESIKLAKERGAFPLYDSEKVDLTVVDKILNSEFNPYKFDMEEIKKIGLRNVSVTSIAPTGSIAFMCEVNHAIEPFFALIYKRNITEGIGNTEKFSITEINPILFKKLKEAGYSEEKLAEIKKYIIENGTIQGCDLVPENIQGIFKTAMEIPWEKHIDIQAAWQEFVTNAVSKTINMENSATMEDVYYAYLYAWIKGLKGITIYRDGSKYFQILNVIRKKSDKS